MKKIDLVNVQQGTKNNYRFSNGNVLPLIARPHGMATFCLQTQSGSNWFYDPTANYYEGIRLTHLFSPWVSDYGHILFAPQSGDAMYESWCNWSSMNAKDAILKPNYLKVHSLRYCCTTELTPSAHGGIMRIIYQKKGAKRLTIVPFDFETEMTIIPEAKQLVGFTKAKGTKRVHKDFALYFVLDFSSKIDLENTPALDAKGRGQGISFAFMDDIVEVKMAFSFISVAQAQTNLEQELKKHTFDSLKYEGETEWEEKLSRIQVSDENPQRMKTFYSCLWRTFLYPTAIHEIDRKGERVHICPETNTVGKGYYFVNNCYWDTVRTLYPLYSIIAREEFAQICEGLVNYYEDTGRLPQCLVLAEAGLMPGLLVEGVFAEAVIQDIVDEKLAKKILSIMVENGNAAGEDGKGRIGANEYQTYGYIPCDLYKESVNNTLDSAYGDYCIAQVAKKLGEDKIADSFYQRAKNYRHLFDEKTGFIRGKDSQGNFRDKFIPENWGGDFCEGGAWQNSFGVYHDIEGLASLYGGKQELIKKMDELFATPPVFDPSNYVQEIHEMGEMAIADFGQCAISNQPSFHIPWIYSALGDEEKTQYWVEKIVDEAFSSNIDGYPGDEDTGSMAAWYIFACLGYYPFCPGSGQYVKSKTLFQKIEIRKNSI